MLLSDDDVSEYVYIGEAGIFWLRCLYSIVVYLLRISFGLERPHDGIQESPERPLRFPEEKGKGVSLGNSSTSICLPFPSSSFLSNKWNVLLSLSL
jgi:hypothetical protein